MGIRKRACSGLRIMAIFGVSGGDSKNHVHSVLWLIVGLWRFSGIIFCSTLQFLAIVNLIVYCRMPYGIVLSFQLMN